MVYIKGKDLKFIHFINFLSDYIFGHINDIVNLVKKKNLSKLTNVLILVKS